MIFLDTGFLHAIFSDEDDHHQRVHAVLEEYRDRRLSDLLVTTNFIMAETLTLARAKGRAAPGVRHDRAVEIGRLLKGGYFGEVHRVSEDEEEAAFEYFAKHRDQTYSYVDCVSFVIMNKMGIREAFTVDRHFSHRYTAIPGPFPK